MMNPQPAKPELIVMLTHHDQTVPDALELFERTKEYPITHWGFKDVGLSPREMQPIVSAMKDARKVTYLEVVSLSEEEGLQGARLAVELGFDILMGTVFYPSIGEYLRDKQVRYYPFPGHVHSHPSILDGTIDEIKGVVSIQPIGRLQTNSSAIILIRICNSRQMENSFHFPTWDLKGKMMLFMYMWKCHRFPH